MVKTILVRGEAAYHLETTTTTPALISTAIEPTKDWTSLPGVAQTNHYFWSNSMLRDLLLESLA